MSRWLSIASVTQWTAIRIDGAFFLPSDRTKHFCELNQLSNVAIIVVLVMKLKLFTWCNRFVSDVLSTFRLSRPHTRESKYPHENSREIWSTFLEGIRLILSRSRYSRLNIRMGGLVDSDTRSILQHSNGEFIMTQAIRQCNPFALKNENSPFVRLINKASARPRG